MRRKSAIVRLPLAEVPLLYRQWLTYPVMQVNQQDSSNTSTEVTTPALAQTCTSLHWPLQNWPKNERKLLKDPEEKQS